MTAVKGQFVMERDLSGIEQHRYRGKIAVVRYLYRILKRAVRRIEEIALVHKAPFVLTADIGHRPTIFLHVRQRHPSCEKFTIFFPGSPVIAILMPTHFRLVRA